MPYYSDEEFEETAKIIRTNVELDEQIQLDAIEFLRRLKRYGYIVDYLRVPDHTMPDDEAKYIAAERRIYIKEGVYSGAENWMDHYRFTIIHECSHALLNHQFERKRSFSMQAAVEKRVASIRHDETDADRLAAAIISPFHRANFTLDTTAQQLARRFGLSAAAASARHATLSRIYRRRYNLPRPLPAGVIDFLAKRQREGHAVTSLPTEDVAALQVRRPTYTGDSCPFCGAFKMIRVGLHLKCDSVDCGTRTGDD
jgi:Zn-dependent peptidase ImmA (M78 family)